VPSIKTVERQLGNLEAFDVAFHHLDGRDVRSDFDGVPGYSFDRAAKNSMTVAAWKEQRFKKLYPGFECEVLDGHGHPCHGGCLLSTVRESYFD
jgi:hypothetical protein